MGERLIFCIDGSPPTALQGKGLTSEDSGPVGFNAELQCGSDGTACQSDHSWWDEGVGRTSLSMGRNHRVTKICPTPMIALLDSNNTDWTVPDFERTGVAKPLPYCNTDLLHRHEVRLALSCLCITLAK